MDETLTPYDPAETLRSADAVILFLADALQTKEADYIAHAVTVAGRAAGMAEINRKTGLVMDTLCNALRANPAINSLSMLPSASLAKEHMNARRA